MGDRFIDEESPEAPKPVRPEGVPGGVKIRWVVGHEGRYAVTDSGDVYSYCYINNTYALSWDEVQEVRKMYKGGVSAKVLSKKFGVSSSYIYKIKNNQSRKTNPRNQPKQKHPTPESTGHLYVNLATGVFYVHRLVLEAFVGESPKGMECRHLDGNPQNNNLENLKWGTRKQNIEDRRRHGSMLLGEDAHKATITNNEARKIKELINEGSIGVSEIAERFGVSTGLVYKIRRGESWAWLEM